MKVRWKTIETEQAEGEGWIIVPDDGTYARYASPSQLKLFEDEETAWKTIARMEARGKFKRGTYKPVRARFTHQRRVDVLEEPPLKLVR